MKNIINIIFVLLVVVGCVMPKGTMHEEWDPFSQTHEKTVFLGHVKSNLDTTGLLSTDSKVTSTFSRQEREGKKEYFFKFNVCLEGPEGSSFPIKKGCKVFFVAGSEKNEFEVGMVVKKKVPGAWNPLFVSQFKIGPLPESVLTAIREEQKIDFKMYGTEKDVVGEIGLEEIREAKKLF